MKPITVLSLFDGISCGRVALKRAGIPIAKYYASEIDKSAITITMKNYPDTIQLGDVTNWREWDIDWASVDLLIGGFPCIDVSVAGKQRGLEGKHSGLFYQYVDILNHIRSLNPNIKFLVENVKMKKEFESVITSYLGVEPVEINSNLLSAQNRRRLYWTNWDFKVPEDKGILLEDIVHEYKDNMSQEDLKDYIVPFSNTLKILNKEVERGKIGYFGKDSQANRVYSIHGKAVTLCGSAGGGAAKMGQYLFGCITPDRISQRQNGQRFNDGNKFYTLTAQDRHGVLIDGYIRKLTPIECERLQNLKDNYTNVPNVSETQRYKALGNGWTVDVIAHILNTLVVDFE